MRNLFLSVFFVLMLNVMSFAQAGGAEDYNNTNILGTAMRQMQKTIAGSRIFNSKTSNEMLRKSPGRAPQTVSRTVKGKAPARNIKTAQKTTAARAKTRTNQTAQTASNDDDAYTSDDDADTDETDDSTDDTTENNAVAADLTFRPTSAPILVDKLFAGTNPNDRQVVFFKEIISRGWNDYRDVSSERGYQYNDLARALSYYVGTNYNIYKGADSAQTALTPAQIKAIYNQFNQHLGSNAELSRMKDDEKQIFCELLVFMTTVPMFMNSVGAQQGNEEFVRQSRAIAKQNLENLLGTTADKLTITNSGVQVQ